MKHPAARRIVTVAIVCILILTSALVSQFNSFSFQVLYYFPLTTEVIDDDEKITGYYYMRKDVSDNNVVPLGFTGSSFDKTTSNRKFLFI